MSLGDKNCEKTANEISQLSPTFFTTLTSQICSVCVSLSDKTKPPINSMNVETTLGLEQ